MEEAETIKVFHTLDKDLPMISQLSTSILHEIASAYEIKIQSLNVIFTDDESMLNLNRSFLDHDWYTDVLTFPYSKDPKVIEGEIYCSLDRIEDNARTFNVNTEHELYRIIIHGMLHLCGETDETDEKREKMQYLEEQYLEKANVPRGTSD